MAKEIPDSLLRPTQDFLESLAQITKHDPRTCQTPGHLVIELVNGTLACGFGGWWPDTGEGFVFDPKDKAYLSGKFVRDNPNPEHF